MTLSEPSPLPIVVDAVVPPPLPPPPQPLATNASAAVNAIRTATVAYDLLCIVLTCPPSRAHTCVLPATRGGPVCPVPRAPLARTSRGSAARRRVRRPRRDRLCTA